MLLSVPIFPAYNFFRQNIWHSIFDQFRSHHIFGDEMTVSSDKTGKGTSRPLRFLTCPFFGTSWMAIRERSSRYYDAQQVTQQISKYHNEGGICEKSYFEVFFWQWSHLSFPKVSTLTDPPFTFFAQICQDFWQISGQYFSLNIWVVYD